MCTATAKSLQSCPTLCDPIDGSPPGSPIPGILQATTLEWAAISFSNVWKWKVKMKSLSCVWFFVTPWTAAYQAPPSMGFSRQEYWSGVPLPSPSCVLDFRKRNGLRILLSSSRWANSMCQTIPKSQWLDKVEVHFFACLQVQHTFERVCYMLSHGTRFHPSWGAIFGQGHSVLYIGLMEKESRIPQEALCTGLKTVYSYSLGQNQSCGPT